MKDCIYNSNGNYCSKFEKNCFSCGGGVTVVKESPNSCMACIYYGICKKEQPHNRVCQFFKNGRD